MKMMGIRKKVFGKNLKIDFKMNKRECNFIYYISKKGGS